MSYQAHMPTLLGVFSNLQTIAGNNPRVIGIRDTESVQVEGSSNCISNQLHCQILLSVEIVLSSINYSHTVMFFVPQEFQKKLVDSRRIVVVGNGGIATELV